MDPLSIIAGAGQIVGFCCATTTSIVRWSIDVRTADERIRGFYDEITTLEKTYAEVKTCLVDPMLRDAAEKSVSTTGSSGISLHLGDARARHACNLLIMV